MFKRAFYGIMIIILLIGMFVFPSRVNPIESQSNVSVDSPHYAWETVGENSQSPASSNADCVEFIIGVGAQDQQIQSLKREISMAYGEVTEIITLGENVQALVAKVSADAAYFFAEKMRINELVEYVEPNIKAQAFYTPNDPYWSDQWGPQKIEANVAWDTTTGSPDILVAIVDTGIDYTHSDLAANYAPLGYDWVNDDADPMDDHGHGTHCAGIVAAEINNGIGIAGLAQSRIMAEKVLSSQGWGWDSWVAQGIIHATDSGAKIISMSLGGAGYSQLLYDAVKYAYDHGVLLVAGAGNTATETPSYPAFHEEVIAVSATDENDNLAWFSTFGEWIDLSAPGVNIYSTLPGNSYAAWSGTSMACPHVSGVAALAWAAFPNYTRDEIRRLLRINADDLGDKGFDRYYGHGRVNARKAVTIGLPDHDIAIASWRHRGRIDPGQTGIFSATIYNNGRNNETDITVQLYVNDTLVDSKNIGFLTIDAFTTVDLAWNTVSIGNYNATCYVVPIAEEDLLSNNVVSDWVQVRFPAFLVVPDDYPTIKAAIGITGEGDIVSVREGRYVEGKIDILNDNITLIADGHTILDGSPGGDILNVKANYVIIDGFDIINSPSYGVSIRGEGNILRNNRIKGNRESIRLYDSRRCTISNNYVLTYSGGIFIENSSNNTICHNKLIGNSYMGGLHISRSSNNNISHNTITGGMIGEALIIYLSEGNIITSNNITGNMHGLALVGSTKNVLRNNKMTSNWCNFAPWRSFFYEYSWQGPNDVDASNTVDGKPICYWVNVSNRIVPSETGCVVLVNCRNITVENLELRNNFDGVFLVNSSNILIRRNNISHHFSNYAVLCCGVFSYFDSFNITVTLNNITANENGIMLWGYNNIVSYNNIANSVYKNVEVFDSSVLRSNNITNSDKGGVVIEGSGCAVISNNIVSNWGAGITLRGSNHTVTLNNIIGNGFCGIQLVLSSECLIDQNNIIRNGYYGVWMYSSSNNKIFHNNFINNTKDLNSDGSSANVWDDGYPSGGNYWNSYNGTDNDSDGIGDTPYVLDANNIDTYPLMNPYAGKLPPKIYSMKISGWIGGRPIEGYYDTTWPFPGTYIYIANSTVQVDTFLTYSVFVDCWKLDDVNVGSDDFVRILMNQNHNLEVFLSVVPPLSVSISPTKIKTKIGRPVTFTSSVFGGKPPYDYQWYVNEREVLNATSPIWTFASEKLGNYTIHLSVRYPFSSPVKSEVALVIVVDLLLVGDINDDDKVDIKDLVLFIKAFGSYPTHPRWNPNADVNSDGKIDIKDLVLLIKHFGEHYP